MSVDTIIPSVVILDPIQRAIKPLVIESIVRVARSREPAICAGDLRTHARIPRAPGARSLAICVMGEWFFLKWSFLPDRSGGRILLTPIIRESWRLAM